MTRDRDKLHVLPLPGELSRERASEERLDGAPRAIQDWFDAQADAPGQDSRLRSYAGALAPGEPSEEGPADAIDPAVGAWLAATALAPDQDARLWAFVDQLVPADGARVGEGAPPSSLAPAPADPLVSANGLPRWVRPAVAAALLLAAASFGTSLMTSDQPGGSPGSVPAQSASTQAVAQAAPASVAHGSGSLPSSAAPAGGDPEPSAPSATVDHAIAAVAVDSVAVDSVAVDSVAADSAQPPGQPQPSIAQPLVAAPAASPPEATPALDAPAPDTVVIVQAEAEPEQPPTILADAGSPPLRRTGDIAAHTGAWREEVVPGLDLRLDEGFAHLQGTEASPELLLADDASIRVDIDRSAVRDDFQQFTVRTRSGTVTVLGTRYLVQTTAGRTHVETRRGLVKVSCADGRDKLVAAGQAADCDPVPDTRILTHMQAMDRAPDEGPPLLSTADRYDVLVRLLSGSTPESFIATADVMLDRAIADDDYRKAIELSRIDAMCALAWDEPARDAARAWLRDPAPVALEHVRAIVDTGCD